MKLRLTMAASALFLGAAPASATTTGPDEVEGHEVRVVNNSLAAVRVFVEDADGRIHNIGRVRRGQYKVLSVANEIAARGPVQVKFVPSDPEGASLGTDEAIRTNDLTLADGQALNAFLEADLTRSVLELALNVGG